MGLQLNFHKFSLFWPSLPGPAILASYPADLPPMRSDRACVLGTPVGDAAFVQAALARRLPEIQAAHSLIAEMDDPQIELHLLRVCSATLGSITLPVPFPRYCYVTLPESMTSVTPGRPLAINSYQNITYL
jgi:hypothetical protein